MARAARRNSKELEERLRALKKEQRRLTREISALARDSGGPSVRKSKGKRVQSSTASRTSAAKGSSAVGVEMKAYFSNGSFRGKRKLRHERAVQRNKAIFMLVIACFALYSFFAWVF